MLRIALAQFDFPVGALASNEARIGALIAEARDRHGAHLVVFPELALCGYPADDLLLRTDFLVECAAALQRIARGVHGIIAVVGWPQVVGEVVFNAASVLREGEIEATCRKHELPNYAVFDECRHFRPARRDAACVFDLGGTRAGLVICEDLWFAEPPGAVADLGASLLLVPNASPFEAGKHARRDALLAERAGATGMAIAYLNLVGGQDDLVFDGASVLADGDGRVHPAAPAFVDGWLLADFDPATRTWRRHAWPATGDADERALIWAALVRGTRDYVRKNGFQRVWVGLSGGIDSALVLAIAVDALGADKVTAVRLPSRYTTGLSNDLAEQQAHALGVTLATLPIEAPFQGFLTALDAATPATLAPATPNDVSAENLQSRCRGVLLMALANRHGGLVLTTGNKSEYAVGYATIYGDMCGAYAPLKDVWKSQVFALANWRNQQAQADGQGASIPPGVIARVPSAELRENQTDQDSLPPYDVLDAILARHVERRESRADIVAAGFEAALVERVLQLVRISEWKRRQAAPGPKVSACAFGRDRRYPITSGWR
ncbi:NAD+ synthase [Dokdonella sp.]|uniref:NAD+ synthase n=1 Tax=Dokdonella sp. TaxID=2291710 RepID=UPI0031BE991A|nr:NAD+ synthase [Dokdonella sp.]